jgi:DNA-binding CsgD family transcriptional regulator
VSRPTKPTTDWQVLTQRQQQIARLLARGLSLMEISRQLPLALPAVEMHLVNLYEMTGSRSRAGFSAWMTAYGPTGDEEYS